MNKPNVVQKLMRKSAEVMALDSRIRKGEMIIQLCKQEHGSIIAEPHL